MTEPTPEKTPQPTTTGFIIENALERRHDTVRILERRLHNLRTLYYSSNESEATSILETIEELESEIADLEGSLAAYKVAVSIDIHGTKMSLEKAKQLLFEALNMKYRLERMMNLNDQIDDKTYIVLNDVELVKRLQGLADNIQTLKNHIAAAMNTRVTFTYLPPDVTLLK